MEGAIRGTSNPKISKVYVEPVDYDHTHETAWDMLRDMGIP